MSPELEKSLLAWMQRVENLLDHLRMSEPADIALDRDIEDRGNLIRKEFRETELPKVFTPDVFTAIPCSGGAYLRAPGDVRVFYRQIATVIAAHFPKLVGAHALEQIAAMPGAQSWFDKSESPFGIPYSFSEESLPDAVSTLPDLSGGAEAVISPPVDNSVAIWFASIPVDEQLAILEAALFTLPGDRCREHMDIRDDYADKLVGKLEEVLK